MRLFAYRLAKDLGKVDVDRDVLDRLSSTQLNEWMAFYHLEMKENTQQELKGDADRNVRNRTRGRH